MRSSDGRVSMGTFLTTVVVMGGLQILQLQHTYNYLRPTGPNQCDCQCTKELHISGGNSHSLKLAESAKHKVQKLEKPKKKDEELYRLKILEAEDKVLDREFAANKSKENKELLEDPEEKNPYQPEEINSGENIKSSGSLVISPLDIDPNINGSSLQCSPNLLLIYVYTAPGNFWERNRVRKTYGGVDNYKGINLKLLFFLGGLGKTTNKYYDRLLNESRKYGDLVLDRSYIDAYRNLTLKGISAIRWIHNYCPKVYRVMKVDDDTMVNPYNLVTFLQGQTEETMNEIICKVTQGVGPIRRPGSKYYVSEDEYPDKYYPPYCQGYGYIFPPKVLPKLIDGFQGNRLIAMEDVFITGITSKRKGIKLHSLTASFATTFSTFDLFLERITGRTELLLVGHVHKQPHVQVFWNLVEQRLHTKVAANGEKK